MKRMIWALLLAVLLAAMMPQAQAAEQGMEVGGIHILKTDMTGKPLAGAEFQLVREADPQELADRKLEKKLVRIGDENRLVVVMSFWPDRAMTGSRQQEVTTDRHGCAAIYGLPYGTYYLVETKAPEGYNRITSAIRVSIHKYSHLTQADGVLDDEGKPIDHTLHIINVRYALPDTGNWGRIQLAAGGAGIILSAAALVLLNLRHHRR